MSSPSSSFSAASSSSTRSGKRGAERRSSGLTSAAAAAAEAVRMDASRGNGNKTNGTNAPASSSSSSSASSSKCNLANTANSTSTKNSTNSSSTSSSSSSTSSSTSSSSSSIPSSSSSSSARKKKKKRKRSSSRERHAAAPAWPRKSSSSFMADATARINKISSLASSIASSLRAPNASPTAILIPPPSSSGASAASSSASSSSSSSFAASSSASMGPRAKKAKLDNDAASGELANRSAGGGGNASVALLQLKHAITSAEEVVKKIARANIIVHPPPRGSGRSPRSRSRSHSRSRSRSRSRASHRRRRRSDRLEAAGSSRVRRSSAAGSSSRRRARHSRGRRRSASWSGFDRSSRRRDSTRRRRRRRREESRSRSSSPSARRKRDRRRRHRRRRRGGKRRASSASLSSSRSRSRSRSRSSRRRSSRYRRSSNNGSPPRKSRRRYKDKYSTRRRESKRPSTRSSRWRGHRTISPSTIVSRAATRVARNVARAVSEALLPEHASSKSALAPSAHAEAVEEGLGDYFSEGDDDLYHGMEGTVRIRKGEQLCDGRYVVVGKSGHGTFGTVFRAIDTKNDSIVAVKVVRSVPRYAEAAFEEAKVLRAIRQNDPDRTSLCVRLLSVFTIRVNHREHVCLGFEPLGESLYSFMKKNKHRGFPMPMVRDFARQILHAVGFCHAMNLIHTDLKPENVLLQDSTPMRTGNGDEVVPVKTDVRLIDFGSATFEDQHHSSIINTRQYRAPEVLVGMRWSFPSDMWSVGCILAELLTGNILFSTHDNGEHVALMEAILERKLPTVMRDAARARDYQLSRRTRRRKGHDSTRKRRRKRRDRDEGSSSSGGDDYSASDSSMPLLDEEGRLFFWRRADQLSLDFVRDAVPLSKQFGHYPMFLDLLQRLLEFDPTKRITAEEAAHHPFFDEVD